MGNKVFSLSIEGLKIAENKLDALREKFGVGVDEIVKAAAYDANDDAISAIQNHGAIDLGAGGGLLSHQSVTNEGPRAYGVGNSSEHAPFVEWGIGRQAKVSDEWAAYARQYKGPYPGTWKEFEKNIQAWMNRHGIPLENTYVIMVKILENGLPARPFLYPAYVKAKARIIKDIKQLFK